MTLDRAVDLLIKLVVLATAVVGLFSVARKARGGETLFSRLDLGILEPIAVMAAFFAFILMFPAFIAAMSWLTRRVDEPSSTVQDRTLPTDSLATAWRVLDSPAYSIVVAASQVTVVSKRDELLVRATHTALLSNEPRVGWLAARGITGTATKDSVLAEVAGRLLELNEFALAARLLPDFVNARRRDEQATRLSLAAAQYAQLRFADSAVANGVAGKSP